MVKFLECAKSVYVKKILIFFRTGLASLLGNGLAVKVFRRKGREITVPEILLLNIAIVDLLLSSVTYPAPIVAAFSHRWIFGDIGNYNHNKSI